MKKSVNSATNTSKDANLSRRDFIKVAGVIVGSAALAACTPQVTATPTPVEATAAFSPLPADTSIPTPTVDAILASMTEGDKRIWDAMPESMPDVEGSYRVFDRERGFLYKDKDGKVVGLWDYNTYKLDDKNPNFIRKAWVEEETGRIIFLDPRDEVNPERVKYPEVIRVTVRDKDGAVIDNKFNGVEIHTTARNYKLNPTLNREVVGEGSDHAEMMAILEEAYRLGLLPQFAEGAMTPSNLEKSPGFNERTLAMPIYEHKGADHKSRKWLGEGLMPYSPAVFPPSDELQIRWAPVLMKQADGEVAGWWAINSVGRDVKADIVAGVSVSVQGLLDNGVVEQDGGLGGKTSDGRYVRTGRGNMLPLKINGQPGLEALIKGKPDQELQELYEELETVATEQRANYLKILSTGKVPLQCKDGTYPAFAKYYIATAS